MIGKLDQRIALQSLSETNTNGQLVQSWTTAATVWGYVMESKGNEAFQAARINASDTIRVQVRYRDDSTPKWRLQWNSQNYGITHIDRSDRRNGYLWLMAKVTGAA
jgi:SPP1 family predicted phage head-tail adaptor